MKIGIYAGSFDPITNGHMDIIERASLLVDKLIVAVLCNPSKSKGMFSIEERLLFLEESTKHLKNVEVEFFSGLLVEYAVKKNANVLIRGLRIVTDFEYEMQMAQINKNLLPTLETILLIADVQHAFLSSSMIRELATFKGDTSGFVPQCVTKYIENKL
ncbi:MAG: pantetheine-phosphate adenylyltransferase [Epulopiscium sp. Nele67-Bin005]|nr:MAG: pantetheine-phosphate adenylyltransferase [Epulopiscium sp. Nele67-Bin005]